MQMDIKKLNIKDYIDPITMASYAFISSIDEGGKNLHCHDFFEIMIVIKGSGIHNINGEKIHLVSNSIIFIRPQDIHCFERFDNNSCQFINLAFPLETLMEASDYLGEGFPIDMVLSSLKVPYSKLSETEKNILCEKINSLYFLPHTDKQYIKMKLRTLLIFILTSYFSLYEKKVNIKFPSWLEEMCLCMKSKENFTTGIEAMINLSGKTHEHICRTFKKYYNTTPIEFINDIKLNYSANLLINSNLCIVDVALESGFESLSRFYYLFKLKYGLTPSNFRHKKQRSIL